MRYLEFSPEEMYVKLENARKLIEENRLSGLLVTAEANYYYFTGYRPHTSWSTFTRPVYLFIPRKADPVLLVQVFVAPEATTRSAVTDVRSYEEINTSPTDSVVEIMKELGMDSGSVGCELGYEQRLGITQNSFNELQAALPGARLVDAADILWKLRLKKYPGEIDALRQAGQMTSIALEGCFNEIREGMSEKEISRLISQKMLEAGADEPGFVIICTEPGGYARISARATDRIIRKGDFVWIDAGVNHKGYWSDFCRAGVVGGATAEQIRLQEIVHDVTMNVTRKVAPGVAVADLAKECEILMKQQGFPMSFDCGRAGHGIGLMSTEPPSIASYDPTVLEAGMVITLEPGIVNDIGCFCVEENILVTENGFEILSGGERRLHTIQLS